MTSGWPPGTQLDIIFGRLGVRSAAEAEGVP